MKITPTRYITHAAIVFACGTTVGTVAHYSESSDWVISVVILTILFSLVILSMSVMED